MGGEGSGRASQIRVVACVKVGNEVGLLMGAGSWSLPCSD
jgi:hypothetical protein